jgi:hypothetical protein
MGTLARRNVMAAASEESIGSLGLRGGSSLRSHSPLLPSCRRHARFRFRGLTVTLVPASTGRLAASASLSHSARCRFANGKREPVISVVHAMKDGEAIWQLPQAVWALCAGMAKKGR